MYLARDTSSPHLLRATVCTNWLCKRSYSVACRGRAQLKPDGTRWRTVGEVKGKHASGVRSQQSCTLPQNMVYPALLPLLLLMRTPRLPVVHWTDPRPQFKWTRPCRWKTKSCFCACAITFETCSIFTQDGQRWLWGKQRSEPNVSICGVQQCYSYSWNPELGQTSRLSWSTSFTDFSTFIFVNTGTVNENRPRQSSYFFNILRTFI